MCETHGLEHLQEKIQAITNAQAARIAPVRQRLTRNILHSQVRMTPGIDSRVVQPCDVRMLEARQDVALYGKSLREVLSQLAEERQLERHFALECPVCASREPNLRHASGTEHTKQL